MNDVPHEVSVAPRRDFLEEAPADGLATVRQSSLLEPLLGSPDDSRQIVKHSLHRWILAEHRAEHAAVAAADIDEGADAGEVVRIQHRLGLGAVNARHCVIEDLGLLRVFRQELEDRFAVDVVEGDLAGLDAVKQLAPGAVMFLAHHDHQRALGARHAAQAFRHGSQTEAALGIFDENADAGQGPQQPV